MTTFLYTWRAVADATPLTETDSDAEPFSTWKALRPGARGADRLLVELPPGSSGEEAAFNQLGKTAPAALRASGLRFWTLHDLPAGSLTGTQDPSVPWPPPWLGAVKVVGGDNVMSRSLHDLQRRRFDVPASTAIDFLKEAGAAIDAVAGKVVLPPVHMPVPHVAPLPMQPFFDAPGAAGEAGDAASMPMAQTAPDGLELASAADDPSKPTTGPQGTPGPAVIGVIDSTIGYLHDAFRRAGSSGQTRILCLWDQAEVPAAAPWQSVEGFDYGRELDSAGIQGLIALSRQAGQSQRSVYLAQGLTQAQAWSHGTHVLAIAAGTADPMAPGAAADAASGLDIVAVQLPSEAVGHTHGVWLNSYVLDGIHYVLRRAPRDAPVIVNISMGGSLGPHDGSSLLEQAIDELVQAWGGRLTVVLAAGNSRDAQMHARIAVDAGAPGSFSVSSVTGDATPNFVDMWSPATAVIGMQVHVADSAGPLAASLTVNPGQAWMLVRTDDPTKPPVALAGLSRPGHAANGAGSQAFLGVAAVKDAQNGPPAPIGDWTVTLNADRPAPFDAWLGRDDIPPGFAGEMEQPQLQFASGPQPVQTRTLSSLAGGTQAIVVGAYRAIRGLAEEMFEPSGEGDADRSPDLCGLTAVGDGPGAPDVWFFSDEPPPPGVLRNSRQGTSFAAPFVARRIANLLAANGNAWMTPSQVLAALQADAASAPDPAGKTTWTSGLWLAP